MSQARKGSLLFGKLKQLTARNKSTFVYETDKTFSQRWIENKVAKIQQQQKFHADESVPLWWKTTGDKIFTTFLIAGTFAGFFTAVVNGLKFSMGKLEKRQR